MHQIGNVGMSQESEDSFGIRRDEAAVHHEKKKAQVGFNVHYTAVVTLQVYTTFLGMDHG